MESKQTSLHIDLPPPPKVAMNSRGKTSTQVIDSWEDDDDLSTPVDQDSGSHGLTGTEEEDDNYNTAKPIKPRNPALQPPPPTPISPRNADQFVDWSPAQVLGGGRPTQYTPPTSSTPTTDLSDRERDRRRPEKTTATASRLIAAGLGMKPAKKTEEQRQYDRAVREQEIRRRTKEKEALQKEREADEKLKAAVWDS